MTNITPKTYDQSKHGISINEISPSARAIISTLIDSGFDAYIVGGAVRDLLLGMHPKDFDIATNATPEQIKNVFKNQCRIIGRRFRLAHVFHNREMYEVATFRADAKSENTRSSQRIINQGHIIRDNVFGNIDSDAMRRDFTCNALYFDIENANVFDFCGGVNDIKAGKLEFIGDASTRIIEDPIRMIRAIRFQSKLGLMISDEMSKAIYLQHQTLETVSSARLFDELVKLFHCGQALKAYKLMNELLLFNHIFPLAIKAINSNEKYKQIVTNALASTDLRLKEQKSVTPIFLFSCFLWPLASEKIQTYTASGVAQYDAINKAANEIFVLTRKKLAIPKIVQIGIRNIWMLQFRFDKTAGKKVLFTLAHPRFRAAYDFLLLRKHESEKLKSLGEWWTHIQTLPKNKQKELLFSKKKKQRRK